MSFTVYMWTISKMDGEESLPSSLNELESAFQEWLMVYEISSASKWIEILITPVKLVMANA